MHNTGRSCRPTRRHFRSWRTTHERASSRTVQTKRSTRRCCRWPPVPCEQADQGVDSPVVRESDYLERATATVRERLRPPTDTRTCTSVATAAPGSSCQPGPISLPVSVPAVSARGCGATSGRPSKRPTAVLSAASASSIPNTQPAVSATGVAGHGRTAPVWHPGGPCP